MILYIIFIIIITRGIERGNKLLFKTFLHWAFSAFVPEAARSRGLSLFVGSAFDTLVVGAYLACICCSG